MENKKFCGDKTLYEKITENPCYKKKAFSRPCIYCGKAIRKWTANQYKDWNKRKAHKKCWKEEQLRKEFEREMAKWKRYDGVEV